MRSKRAIENNVKWNYPLDIWIVLYSNRCRDGYRTRIFFSSIYIHGSFCIISADFKLAGIRLEYINIWPSEIFGGNILLVGSVAVEPNHSSSAVIYTHAFSGSNSTNQDDNVSYWEWEWHTPSHIGDTKAPKGYE
jgi:hypothetical protein